jgi:hypothetical protein
LPKTSGSRLPDEHTALLAESFESRRRRRSPDAGLPASRGKGTRIFEDRQDLKLVEATSLENGVALLRYEVKK